MSLITGNQAYQQYGYESTFATAQSTRNYVMGLDESISGVSINNGKVPLKMLGSPVIAKYAFGRFEGSYSSSFVLSNPWCFAQMFPYKSTSGGNSPYTHTLRYDKYESASGDNDKFPNSITHELAFDLASDLTVLARGSIMESLNVNTSVGDLIRCSSQHRFAGITKGTSLDSSPATDQIDFPYTFEHGSWSFGGTARTEVQKVDLSFNSGLQHLYGIGSKNPTVAYRSMLGITGSFSLPFIDSTFLDYATARSEVSEAILKFTNGGSGAAERSITITLTGLGVDPHSIDSIVANEPIMQGIQFTARSAKITAVNNKADPPT